MFSGKKGLEALYQQIMAVVSLLVLVGFIPVFAGSIISPEDKDLTFCRLTLLGESKVNNLDLGNNFNAACPTLYKELPSFGSIGAKQNIREIAVHMTKAWWATGQGSIDNLWGNDGTLASLNPLQFREGEGCYTLYLFTWDGAEVRAPTLEEFMRTQELTTRYNDELKKDEPISFSQYIQYDEEGRSVGSFEIFPIKESTALRDYPEEITQSISEEYVYAISIRSPDSGERYKNVVMLSSQTYAQNFGCVGARELTFS